ncbi:MAG: BlaI/MecI/CopY family transcriptional regulator [Planctomycetota bacterium]|nr:BlaI/MecI/CopY family transcriptional regulator [Planctomycetota bacterium]
MSPRSDRLPRPTEAELAILTVLWRLGRATVREVHEDLAGDSKVGLTTVLKLMQIMVDKGLIERDTSVRPQVFWASQRQQQTQKRMVRDLLDRAFQGSPGELVLQALSLRRSSPEELARIKALLRELEGSDS